MEITINLITLAKCALIGFFFLIILFVIIMALRRYREIQREREWNKHVGVTVTLEEQPQKLEDGFQLGEDELGEALRNLIDVIDSSVELSSETKLEHIEIAYKIGSEASKIKPNKILLKALSEGLLIGSYAKSEKPAP
ncbi:MAG: hypothetical protein AB1564_11815 [Chloroflexota bacterium]